MGRVSWSWAAGQVANWARQKKENDRSGPVLVQVRRYQVRGADRGDGEC